MENYTENLEILFANCSKSREGMEVSVYYRDPDREINLQGGSTHAPFHPAGPDIGNLFYLGVDVMDIPDWSWPLVGRVHPDRSHILVDTRAKKWVEGVCPNAKYEYKRLDAGLERIIKTCPTVLMLRHPEFAESLWDSESMARKEIAFNEAGPKIYQEVLEFWNSWTYASLSHIPNGVSDWVYEEFGTRTKSDRENREYEAEKAQEARS
jgi:hypothetical protein